MDLKLNRIYIGRKSLRKEAKKVYDWCNANDTLLMKLRLAGWYGKGFKIWQNHDTARFGSQNILSKFKLLLTIF